MRLIDADALKERLIANIGLTNCIDTSFKEVPTIDVVEVAEKRIAELEAEVERLKALNEELREKQTYIDHWGDKWMTSAKDVPTMAYNHGFFDGEQGKVQDKIQDIEVVQCKDCEYYMNDARHCLNDLINADMIIEPNWFCANAVRKDYDACRN